MDIKTPTKEERIANHVRGIKIVLIASLLGVLAGLLSSPLFLSQPVYTTLSQAGPSVLQSYPSALLTNVSTVAVNSADPLNSATAANASSFALHNGSARLNSDVVIPLGSATITSAGPVVLVSNVPVTNSSTPASQTNASVVLTNALILQPGAPLSQSNPSVLLTNDTVLLTNPQAPNHAAFAFLILALAIYVQKFLFPLIKVKSAEFAFKDWFFISFMTFCFWYITWTLILNPIGVPVGQIYHYPFGPFF